MHILGSSLNVTNAHRPACRYIHTSVLLYGHMKHAQRLTFSNPGVADSTVVILHRSDDNHHTLPIFEPLCKFMRCGCKRLQSFSIFQFFMLWMYIPGLQKKKK